MEEEEKEELSIFKLEVPLGRPAVFMQHTRKDHQ